MRWRHTDADLYHQWEEAEGRAERWENTAKEERKRHEREISDIRAELRREMARMRRELEGKIESITEENRALREENEKLREDNERLKSMRHKVRVVILKQWKRPGTIFRNLKRLNTKLHCNMSDEDIYKVANSRLGWYRTAAGNVVNFLLSPKALSMPNKKENRPGLVDPLAYYLGNT